MGFLSVTVASLYWRMRKQRAYDLFEIVFFNFSVGSSVSMLYYCNGFERCRFSIKRWKLGVVQALKDGHLLL